MLAPRDRQVLLQALRPPLGHRLDRAIGTSFSLDLIALLTAPLAFTFFAWEDQDGRPVSDPLALLQAVRKHADRIHLFCQAGRITVPKAGQTLLGYLEHSVIEARAPLPGGIFHPKTWVLRFVDDDGGDVRYRVLCLSRNLTFDRSWDTVLLLDGELTPRANAFAVNHPLGDFVRDLPGLAVRELRDDVRAAIDQFQHELRRVHFELPDGVEEIAFWPLGLGARALPFASPGRRMLAMAPFVTADRLDEISTGRPPGVLISTPESLDCIPSSVLARFDEVLAVSPDATPEEEDPSEEEPAPDEDLSGLHAKLYVVDDGWNARLWTGSANATGAAFHRNVELLVELVGKKSALGIDAVLGGAEASGGSLRDLLQPYGRDGEARQPTEREEMERQLDKLRHELAGARLAAIVTAADADDRFSLSLVLEEGRLELPAGVTLTVWPVTLPQIRAVPATVDAGPIAVFPALTFEALTSFFAFELMLDDVRVRFTLNPPLRGAPEDRRERLLRSLLRDKDQVLRLLLMLLSADELSAADLGASLIDGPAASPAATAAGLPLVESLLRALERSPQRIEEVARLVDDLNRTDDGRALLPDGFAAVWAPILAVHRERSP